MIRRSGIFSKFGSARGVCTAGAVLLAAGMLCMAATAGPAEAANGDNLVTFDASVTAGIPACVSGVGTGLAYDGTNLLLSCMSSNVIERVNASTHTNAGAVTVTGLPQGNDINAMAWDATRNRLWVCNGGYTVVLVNMSTGAVDNSVAPFSVTGCFDGLAYDGSDDTIWASADANSTTEHYTTAGALIQSFSNTGLLGAYGNSGIAVGGGNLYLGNNGGSQIYTVDKAFTSSTLFATFPARIEDLECDGRTFSPAGAIWSQDAYDRILNAWEIPPGLCAFGGIAACGDGNLDAGEQCDDNNLINGDGCDANCQLETPASTTTTTMPPATEACCTGLRNRVGAQPPVPGCYDTTPEVCQIEFGGYSLGPDTSCAVNAGQCVPDTTLPPTTTTTLPPTTVTTTTSTTTSTTLSTCGDGVVAGLEECDDGGTAPGDGCDDQCAVEECWSCDGASPTNCTALDGVPCDDGDVCTTGDVCVAGTCSATVVAIRAACDWVLIGGDPTKRVRALTKEQSQVNGDICADRLVLGELTQNSGDVVTTEATFRNGLRISPNVTVVGDVVTGGGAVRGKPRGTLLPGLAVDEVAGGGTVVKDATSNYNTTGTHAQVGACDTAAQDGVDSGAAFLLSLPSTATLGNVKVSTKTGPLTISPATVPGVTAGGVNVIDFGALRVVTDAVLTLDAGGDPTTVYVLRVADKMVFALRSQLAFANGQLAENTIILANSKKCHIGLSVTGGGVIVCPNGALKLNALSTWGGALLGGKGKVFVGQKAVLNHVPFLGL